MCIHFQIHVWCYYECIASLPFALLTLLDSYSLCLPVSSIIWPIFLDIIWSLWSTFSDPLYLINILLSLHSSLSDLLVPLRFLCSYLIQSSHSNVLALLHSTPLCSVFSHMLCFYLSIPNWFIRLSMPDLIKSIYTYCSISIYSLWTYFPNHLWLVYTACSTLIRTDHYAPLISIMLSLINTYHLVFNHLPLGYISLYYIII